MMRGSLTAGAAPREGVLPTGPHRSKPSAQVRHIRRCWPIRAVAQRQRSARGPRQRQGAVSVRLPVGPTLPEGGRYPSPFDCDRGDGLSGVACGGSCGDRCVPGRAAASAAGTPGARCCAPGRPRARWARRRAPVLRAGRGRDVRRPGAPAAVRHRRQPGRHGGQHAPARPPPDSVSVDRRPEPSPEAPTNVSSSTGGCDRLMTSPSRLRRHMAVSICGSRSGWKRFAS